MAVCGMALIASLLLSFNALDEGMRETEMRRALDDLSDAFFRFRDSGGNAEQRIDLESVLPEADCTLGIARGSIWILADDLRIASPLPLSTVLMSDRLSELPELSLQCGRGDILVLFSVETDDGMAIGVYIEKS